ncbi:hypothetical protein FACS1894178_1760 [Bacteroidia bacterium]|nr:hypothetical protein FACS1894178_1760 [Bacteroidia bacterium]
MHAQTSGQNWDEIAISIQPSPVLTIANNPICQEEAVELIWTGGQGIELSSITANIVGKNSCDMCNGLGDKWIDIPVLYPTLETQDGCVGTYSGTVISDLASGNWTFHINSVAAGICVNTNPTQIVNTNCLESFIDAADTVPFEIGVVEGNSFIIGAATSTYGAEPNAHPVTLSDFFIGKTEVTQALFETVMGKSFLQLAKEWGKLTDTCGVGPNYPMYFTNWNDIVGTGTSPVGYVEKGVTYYQNGFCYKLSVMTNGGILGSRHYRLPTEAEWEYAARGGAYSPSHQGNLFDYDYSGGDTIDTVAWWGGANGNSSSKTHPVGTKRPNILGLYDMSGNVNEWCSDYYNNYSAGAATDPIGPSTPQVSNWRVFRNGNYSEGSDKCSVNYRYGLTSTDRSRFRGFRVACSVVVVEAN